MKLLRRIPVLVVVLALLALSTAWAAHRHKQDLAADTGSTDHCELCLQVGRGIAAASVVPALVIAAAGWTLWLALKIAPCPAPHSFRRYQQARAPPR
ncbi:MAG: hypothetical protein RLZZ200_2439 [Pseudomonadota bacterium]